ncbi:hypothetical protein [Rhizobium sp. G21]|uniref:hypothetical protein n=1 Tax=Rhizobium sp. G21 TaxID=2758439 RepID=UPI0016011E6E|nr:hypothetical protein [Rhizobium sp. G21]MBB1247790.1 hypothetical protein [Rhizobium sp. G21]
MKSRFTLQLDQIEFGIRRVNSVSARKFLATAQALLGELGQQSEQTPELIDDIAALDKALCLLASHAAAQSIDAKAPALLAQARRKALNDLERLHTRLTT